VNASRQFRSLIATPAKEAVIQLVFIAPSLQNHVIPAQAGTHLPASVVLSEEARP